jgi:hypothetical protein
MYFYTPVFEQNKYGTYNVTVRRIRATIAAVEKQLSITYSECVFVDFGISVCVCRLLYPAMLDICVYEFHENEFNGS